MFTNVRLLLLMKENKDDKNLLEKVEYYGEDLTLKMTGLELKTCFVGLTYDDSLFETKENEKLVLIIVFVNIESSLRDLI